MSVDYGLPLIVVLVIVFALVREAARRYKLRRERKRRTARYYWQPKETFGTPTRWNAVTQNGNVQNSAQGNPLDASAATRTVSTNAEFCLPC